MNSQLDTRGLKWLIDLVCFLAVFWYSINCFNFDVIWQKEIDLKGWMIHIIEKTCHISKFGCFRLRWVRAFIYIFIYYYIFFFVTNNWFLSLYNNILLLIESLDKRIERNKWSQLLNIFLLVFGCGPQVRRVV